MKLNKILKDMDPEKKEILAMDVNARMAEREKMKYIKKVSKLEKVDLDTAWAICTGQTDPEEPEYTLGYKMADPAMIIALFIQTNKEGRRNAADKLIASLNEEEKKIFLEDVFNYETAERIKTDKKVSFAEKRLSNWVKKSQKSRF
jgi:hypothetical protein